MSICPMGPQVYKAAKLGDIALLQRVVDEDSSRLLRVTPNENTVLHVSVRFGHTEFVKEVYFALLQHNSCLEGNTEYNRSLSLLTQVNLEGDSTLHVAVREGHLSIAKFLIEKIMPWHSDHDIESGNCSSLVPEIIRIRNRSKNTALHEAVRRNDLEMVKLLTEADHDLEHLNYDADVEGRGESPLYLAARDGRLDILDQIFHVCRFPAHGGPHGRTALHVAVVERRQEVVKKLLDKMGSVIMNKKDKNGRIALHYVVSNDVFQGERKLERIKPPGDLKIVQELLRRDTSNVYELDKDGLSPFHIAALESSNQVFGELIQQCPDFGELLDKKRRNVLHFAVMSKDSKKISFALKQQELQELINKPDDDGNTPFHLAATIGSFWDIKPFRSNGRVDIKATKNKDRTAAEIFLTIHGAKRVLTRCWQICMVLKFWPLGALKGSGEHNWIIGGEKEQICSYDPKNQAEGGEKKAATTKVVKSQKDMGKTLLIVASLIATVAFTAFFKVPGGYSSDNGNPILQHNGHFQKFILFDSAALSLSLMTLIVMFLAPIADDLFYSSFLKMGTFLICLAILFTSAAFHQGLMAVLPICDEQITFICSFSSYGKSFTDIATRIFTHYIVPLFYAYFLFDALASFILGSPSQILKFVRNYYLLWIGVIFLVYVLTM